eukprot:SM000252S09060  [mRNA]  locus=s252:38402:40929:+ [translate_table: standard]
MLVPPARPTPQASIFPRTIPALANGTCSTTPMYFNVSSVAQILARAAISNTTTVVLVLQQDIVISTTLVLDATFSCTVLLSAAMPGFTIQSTTDDVPAVKITGASNILSMGVHYTVPITSSSPEPCNPDDSITGTDMCAAVLVYGSSNVQIVQSNIFGRVDVFFTDNSRFDAITSTSIPQDIANFRFGHCGYFPDLAKSNNVVSNSDISGAYIGILLQQSTVGVSLLSNSIHGFPWAGIQIGQGSLETAGDAVLNTVNNNYILQLPSDNPVADSGGIYVSTHWLSPGNRLQCNYVVGTELCIYLDSATSGFVVDGQVCAYNKQGGVKQNNGQFNKIISLVSVAPSVGTGFLTCQSWENNNCNHGPAMSWATSIQDAYVNEPKVIATYPYLNNWCRRVTYNGVKCNPAGAPSAIRTANCSGIPITNSWRSVIVAGDGANPPQYDPVSCAGLTQVPTLNSISYRVYSGSDVSAADPGFNNPSAGDFGFAMNSTIFQDTGFRSCPRVYVVPRLTSTLVYFAQFQQSYVRPQWPSV